jgi:hypothetical protein
MDEGGLVSKMSPEQKLALQLAIRHLAGDHAALTTVEQRLIEKATGRQPYDWPSDGFHRLAPQIIVDAIARDGFFKE